MLLPEPLSGCSCVHVTADIHLVSLSLAGCARNLPTDSSSEGAHGSKGAHWWHCTIVHIACARPGRTASIRSVMLWLAPDITPWAPDIGISGGYTA